MRSLFWFLVALGLGCSSLAALLISGFLFGWWSSTALTLLVCFTIAAYCAGFATCGAMLTKRGQLYWEAIYDYWMESQLSSPPVPPVATPVMEVEEESEVEVPVRRRRKRKTTTTA